MALWRTHYRFAAKVMIRIRYTSLIVYANIPLSAHTRKENIPIAAFCLLCPLIADKRELLLVGDTTVSAPISER